MSFLGRKVFYTIGAASAGGAVSDLLFDQTRAALVSRDNGDTTMDLELVLCAGDAANGLDRIQEAVPAEVADALADSIALNATIRAQIAVDLNVDPQTVTDAQVAAGIIGGGYGGATHMRHSWRLVE